MPKDSRASRHFQMLQVHPHSKGVDFRGAAGDILFANAYARLTLADGSRWDTRGGTWRASSRGWQCEAAPGDIRRPAGDFTLAWEISPGSGGLLFRARVSNTGAQALALRHLDVLIVPTCVPSEAVPLLCVQQTGYQSWSFATPLLPLHHQPPLAGGPIAGPWQLGAPDGSFWSPWCTLMQVERGPCILWGFLEARAAVGCIGLRPGPLGLLGLARQYGEDCPLAPGETAQSDALLLLVGDNGDLLLERYASASGSAMAAPSRERTRGIPRRGWCSWYTAYEGVSETLMRETVAALQQENAPVEVVLLDDGYQTALGDWCRVNAKFPSGLPAIAQCIRQAGYHPGIWWAPFIAAENSEVWQEHPNWFLRDATGNPSLALFNWNTRCFVLDLTQPEVLRHLEAITRYLTRDVGFSFLKLDFLYAGALPGSRYNPGTNSLSAYRLGLRTIREAAGDAWILGCGAPLLPSVGLVDAMRTSPDVAGSWQDPDPDGSAPALQNAIRANLARGWMQPHWWLNDPDCVFLSDTHPPATPSEREALLTVARLLGGLHFFSDPVHRVPAVAYHTLRDDESCPGTSLRAFRPDSDGLATRAWKATGTGNRHWLAYFNWGDQSKPETFDPQDWPMLPRGPWTVTDLQERHQWRHRRTVSLGLIPAHGLRVLQVQSREPSVKQA